MRGILSLVLLVFVFCFSARAGNAPYFFTCEAKSGDGITILLNRYNLDGYECNLDKFLELNKLKKADPLLEGKNYMLPVLIYHYNGKSIRSTLLIKDMETAQRIANYNQLILNRNLRKSDYESSGILWVPYHELHCITPASKPIALKPIAVKISRPVSSKMTSIFGHEYSHVDHISDKLRGRVFYISSGHGGPDPGAITKIGGHNICEDEYAYDVALRLARNLMEIGATVHIVVQDESDGIRNDDILTCDTDEKTMGSMIMPINQLARLKQRTDAINKLFVQYQREGVKDQTLICIHVDSRSASEEQDVFFYHCQNSTAGEKLASTMRQVFQEKYVKYRPGASFKGTISCRNLYEVRVPLPTTLYIELANIRNESDRKRILPSTNRQALANWLCEGLSK